MGISFSHKPEIYSDFGPGLFSSIIEMRGNAVADYFGYSASVVGDIDGDGYDDIIVGAYGKNAKQGAAYVVYGDKLSTMPNIDLSSVTLDPATNGFMVTGNAADDSFGRSLTL